MLDALGAAFAESAGELEARLIAALAAGLEAGGEEGPLHSAGLLVADAVDWPVTDLRVDWARRPDRRAGATLGRLGPAARRLRDARARSRFRARVRRPGRPGTVPRRAVITERGATLATVTAMRFTLRQLQYFVAAAEAGSVTDAALNIPVSQSSVSAAIAQLEAALGVQLLIRHHAQGISPTAEGRQFLDRARALLRDADELERFASELTADLSGTLHLGCLVTLAPLVTPRLGQGFRERHPAVSLEMVEAGQADLVTGLRSGQLSVALTYDLDLAADLTFAPLASLPPFALLGADHPLAATGVGDARGAGRRATGPARSPAFA